jgi:hypothetical protein
MAMFNGCKDVEVTPVDKLVGDYNLYGSIPQVNSDATYPVGNGTVRIEKLSNGNAKIRIGDNGIRVFDFPDCKIVSIDTTGYKGLFYAKIIEQKNNTEIGKVIDDYAIYNPPQISGLRTRILFTFPDDQNNNTLITWNAIKK